MVFRQLYDGFQDIDARVLTFYRNYAEKWEERGHGRYGLPLFLTTHMITFNNTFGMNIPDNILNWGGFLYTTKEPERSFHQDVHEYFFQRKNSKITTSRFLELYFSRFYVAITTPLRITIKKLALWDTPVTSDGVLGDGIKADPLMKSNLFVNRHLRLPMLVAGVGFLAKGMYELGHSLYTRESLNYESLKTDFSIASGFLITSSSAYFKDADDSHLGKKRKSLRQLLQEAWESLSEKTKIKVPVPATQAHRSLEELATEQ